MSLRAWCGMMCLLASVLVSEVRAVGPEPVLLWPAGAPGAVGQEEQDQPTIRVYTPPAGKACGTGVIICPGGGYAVLATDHEGHQVAQWFAERGVTAFVLRYRLGRRYKHPVPLQDAQRAIRFVRSQPDKYGVVPQRIGIMGFSAGGHLASTAATHFEDGKPDHADPVERVSCRPDFAILGYPVVSFTADFAHKGSGGNLLGDQPDPELLKSLSNETQVTERTPPTFLFHTNGDTGVPPENSVAFYLALRKAKVPAELHIYQFGPHGVGLAPAEPGLNTWITHAWEWLRTNGLLADGKRTEITGQIHLEEKPLRWGQIRFTSVDNPYRPLGFAMISNGKYTVPAATGIYQNGEYTVEVYDLGGVVPHPTLEAMRQLSKPGSLRISLKETDKNAFDFAF